jgi:hypothetical protein
MNSLKIQGINMIQGSINFNKNIPSRWYAANSAEANSWRGVKYGNGLYVAVADTGTNRVMTSPDGINWTARSAPIGSYKSITYGNGLFVAVGSNCAMYSSDGINWYSSSILASSWNAVTYGNGFFVAVANSGSPRLASTTSPDVNWGYPYSSANTGVWNAITYDITRNKFLVVGTETKILASSSTPNNGNEWSTYTNVLPTAVWLGAAVDSAGKAVVVSATDAYPAYYSLDGGVSWINGNAPGGPDWNAIAASSVNDTFVAIANNGTNRILATTDAATWSTQASPQVAAWRDVTNGGGKYVAVAESGPGGSPLSQVMWAYD